MGSTGGKPVGIQPLRLVAVPSEKAKEAQDAQIIFGDAFGLIADEPHAPRCEIVEPRRVVVDCAIACRR